MRSRGGGAIREIAHRQHRGLLHNLRSARVRTLRPKMAFKAKYPELAELGGKTGLGGLDKGEILR
jgi:hypothetical protein